MQAFDLKGEVITTPFSFASTTHAIVRNGLKPVFCDINPDDYTIDTSKIESLITDKTSAIVPVHVYGNTCNVEEIDRIAKKYGLKVIYDSAHAFGEKYKGIGIGAFGDASCFSFHATKVFNTVEGGAVCFKDKELGDKLYGLKNFGIRDTETVDAVGSNAKMNEFCAAMGLCNLRHIYEEISKRKKVHEKYIELLGDINGIKLNPIKTDVECNYSYFPIVIDEEIFGTDRDEVFAKLEENGIGARKYFYPLISDFDCYRDKYDSSMTPIASYVSKRVLTLPMYADLSLDDVQRICEVIIKSKRNI
jgi:dTDP-4-amino-4,6-dideoxygalactose transaminase